VATRPVVLAALAGLALVAMVALAVTLPFPVAMAATGLQRLTPHRRMDRRLLLPLSLKGDPLPVPLRSPPPLPLLLPLLAGWAGEPLLQAMLGTAVQVVLAATVWVARAVMAARPPAALAARW
jgi:hypothetical protein